MTFERGLSGSIRLLSAPAVPDAKSQKKEGETAKGGTKGRKLVDEKRKTRKPAPPRQTSLLRE